MDVIFDADEYEVHSSYFDELGYSRQENILTHTTNH